MGKCKSVGNVFPVSKCEIEYWIPHGSACHFLPFPATSASYSVIFTSHNSPMGSWRFLCTWSKREIGFPCGWTDAWSIMAILTIAWISRNLKIKIKIIKFKSFSLFSDFCLFGFNFTGRWGGERCSKNKDWNSHSSSQWSTESYEYMMDGSKFSS